MMKFDINKIKEKLQADKEKQESAKSRKAEKDITKDILVKVASAGKHKFRAYPYIYNKNYETDPFPERYYHFGIPGNRVVYCPKKNKNEKCHICDFVWKQLTEMKGTPAVKEWREYLPQKRVFIPGEMRGRESEGTKFFALSTYEDKMSKHHQKISNALQDEDTFDFLDPVNGYDLELHYEETSEEQKKMFFGAKFKFSELNVARTRSPLASDVEARWAEIEASFPNVDKDIPKYEEKSEEDTLDVVLKWPEEIEKEKKWQNKGKPVNEAKDTDGAIAAATEVSKEDLPVAVEKKVEVKTEVEPAKLSDADARKKKVQDMLKKANKE
jgi:hypothetical protein